MKKVKFSDFSVKVWLVVTSMIMAVNLFFVLTLMDTAPKVNVIAQLLTPNVMTFDQAVEATSFSAPVGDKKLIEEMLVRYYIENRKEIIPDVLEMGYRWGGSGPIKRLSSPSVYRSFISEKGDYITEMKSRVDAQSVYIRRIQRRGNVFTVDFELYTKTGPIEKRSQDRRAIITISENPRYRGFWKDFSNPFGTTITKYDETKVFRTQPIRKN